MSAYLKLYPMWLANIPSLLVSLLSFRHLLFSIKSLLDLMRGQKIDTDQFMSNSIHSRYYTTSDFLSAKFSNKHLSIFHLNISSLQKHIDELRTLLICTNANFDVICISETRLHNEAPLSINVSKTEFIIFKPPKKTLNQRIVLKLNGNNKFESPKIKYLGESSY